MPNFEFDDYIEPLTLTFPGRDGQAAETYRCMPAIPATKTAEFMDLFAKVPPLIARLTSKDPDDDGVDESKLSDEEKAQRALAKQAALDALPAEEREAKLAEARKRSEDKLAAYREFIDTSVTGLQFVLVPADAERLMARANDPERPLKPILLATMFSKLAGYYLSGGSESEAQQGAGPTGDDSASSLSSDTTGGTSEASSSPESVLPNSGPGTTTT